MTPMSYVIPAAHLFAYETGGVELFGAILKDTATGRIVGHVQPTQVLDELLNIASGGVGNTISQGFSPLGAVSAVQNQAIIGKIAAIQQTLGVLQTLQVASLAVSGLGLGVSVAGFAVMHRRLNGIDAAIEKLSGAVARLTAEQRQDEVRRDLADVATEIDAVETLQGRTDKAAPGHAAQARLATLAGQLERHVVTHAEQLPTAGLSTEDLEFLWSLAAAIRLCHDMGARALYTIDDIAAAKAVLARQGERYLSLAERIPPPDTLVRLASLGVTDRAEVARIRAEILPMGQHLDQGMREAVAAITSQASLSGDLVAKGIRGPAFLERVAEEREEPLLLVPAGVSQATVPAAG
ncbi:hypothetical protein ACW9UR_06195 [Halovulum sp. GXIMD14794]